MVVVSQVAEEASPPASRRERKRQETRDKLVRAALDLFGERGFDDVTVTDIAERADVDPSTFFRHFGSKDAVLFVDVTDYLARVRPALSQRPADEPVLESLAAAASTLVESSRFDPMVDSLRASLASTSPSIHAQALVLREQLVEALTDFMSERLGVDKNKDPRPYLAAVVWVSAFDWYRATASGRPAPVSATKALEQVSELVAPALEWVNPRPARKTRSA